MEEFFSGMTGTIGGFCLRLTQSLLSVFVLYSFGDFSISIVFKSFAIAVGAQLLWSILTAAIDISGILFRGDLQNRAVIRMLIVGDLLACLVLHMASSAARGLLLLEVGNDYKFCVETRCGKFALSAVVVAGVTSLSFVFPFIQNLRFLLAKSG